MKKILIESSGAALMVFGAVILMLTYFPVINPTQYDLNSNGHGPTTMRYIVGTVVSFIVLACAWKCNQCAKRLRNKELKKKPNKTPHPAAGNVLL